MVVDRPLVDRSHQLRFPPYFARPSDILIGGGTRVQDIGLDLDGEIVATPGHTVDSISMVLDDGDAFVGDAAANMLQWAGPITTWSRSTTPTNMS